MKSNIRRSIRNFNRYQTILRVFVKYGFWDIVDRIKTGLLPDMAKNLIRMVEKKELADLSTAERLRMVFDELGATFIKLGQILSLRPDLIPAEIAQEFSKLQDEAAPEAFEKIEAILNREYKKQFRELFVDFDEQPLAAASVAHVHKAILKSGELVAVKILRPNVKKLIETDIDILINLALLLEKHIPESRLYDPVGIVKEFDRIIHKELNLVLEGRNIDIFNRNMKDDPTIKIPHVYWEYTAEKILVMDYIQGIKISDLQALDDSGIDRKQLAENGAKSILKQVFEFGFFHADPHPGNLFVLPGNVIAPIDFGMVGRIDDEMRNDLLNVLRGIVDKDAYRVARVLLKIGQIENPIDFRALQLDILELLDRYYGIPLNRIDTVVLLNEFMELIRRYRIKLPPDLVMMGRALVISEAVGVRLYPEFNLFDLLIPYTKNIFFDSINPIKQYRQIIHILEQSTDLLKTLPEDIKNILLKIKNDRLLINLEHKGLENLANKLDRASNRLAFAILIASIIVGSSLVIQLDEGPLLWGYQGLGVIGYILASIFGIWLLISILKSGKL